MVSNQSSNSVRKSAGRARRAVATLGAISVLLAIGIPAAHADPDPIEYIENGFTYTVFEGAATITGYDGISPTVNLVIPTTLGGVPTTEIADYAFFNDVATGSDLTGYVRIPNTVTFIGDGAFQMNDALEIVEFDTSEAPSRLFEIGELAFMETGLTSLSLPNSLVVIGPSAFYGLSSLTSVTFGTSQQDAQLQTIGASAFQLTGITGSLALPDTMERINESAFYGIGGATGPELSLASGISSSQLRFIGSSAFNFRATNTSLVIPDSVETIEDSAFNSFALLRSLTFGMRTASIGEIAFQLGPEASIQFTGNAPAIGALAFSPYTPGPPNSPSYLSRWQGGTGWGSTYDVDGDVYDVVISEPTVTSVSPNSGIYSGGSFVEISGTGFASGALVVIGGATATDVTVENPRLIRARTPMHAAGAVDITVTNPPAYGSSRSGSLVDAFTYTGQATPPVNGGGEPVPTPTTTVPVSQLAQPVPTELSPGVGSLLINGVATPVVVEKSADGKDVIISGGGVRLVLSATGVNGQPLPLGADGSLVVSVAGGIPMVGSGFAAGSTVTLFMFSTPVTLGTATVNAAGAYSTTAVIPGSTTTGSHTIQVVGTSTSGQPIALSLGMTVKSAATATAKPSVHVSRSRTHSANGRVSVEARGVQVGCSVKFWVKGSTALVKAGKAGIARATLKAPSAQGNWSVTATTSGKGCSQSTSSTRLLVR